MLKISFTIFFSLIFSNLTLRSQDTISSLNYEVEDYLCGIEIELDSCNYIILYNELYHWLNTPYKYAGNSASGIDCSGLVKNVCKSAYNVNLTGGSKNIYHQISPIKNISDLKEGDILFFKIKKDQISHVGIYLKGNYFVHASRKGVIISNLSEPYYQKYYFSGGRIL